MLAALLLVSTLTGCASGRPADLAPARPPDVIPSWLTCPPWPAAPAQGADDVALATWLTDAEAAHGVCRDHVRALACAIQPDRPECAAFLGMAR